MEVRLHELFSYAAFGMKGESLMCKPSLHPLVAKVVLFYWLSATVTSLHFKAHTVNAIAACMTACTPVMLPKHTSYSYLNPPFTAVHVMCCGLNTSRQFDSPGWWVHGHFRHALAAIGSGDQHWRSSEEREDRGGKCFAGPAEVHCT